MYEYIIYISYMCVCTIIVCIYLYSITWYTSVFGFPYFPIHSCSFFVCFPVCLPLLRQFNRMSVWFYFYCAGILFFFVCVRVLHYYDMMKLKSTSNNQPRISRTQQPTTESVKIDDEKKNKIINTGNSNVLTEYPFDVLAREMKCLSAMRDRERGRERNDKIEE